MKYAGGEPDRQALFEMYKDMLYRIAYANLKNRADAEDAVQEAFVRFLKTDRSFAQCEHERAWFIRVVINVCHDMQKSAWAQRIVCMDELPENQRKDLQVPYVETDETLWRVLALPEKYRSPLYLFYYEDYSIREIAESLELEEGTVKTRLKRGRDMIKNSIRKERGKQ